jgi:hypothetical protein
MRDLLAVLVFVLGTMAMFGSLVVNYDKTSEGIHTYAEEVSTKNSMFR